MARPPKIKPGTNIEQMVENYFEHCENTKEVRELKNGDTRIRQEQPSMIGLAVWLDVSRLYMNTLTVTIMQKDIRNRRLKNIHRD